MIFGYVLITSGRPILVGVGSSLIAAGITGWVVLVYVMLSQGISEQLRIIVDFGLTNAFSARSVHIRAEYDQRLDRARESIDIVGFGLESLRQDYHDEFARWKGRANVRILLLDPMFPDPTYSYAAQRDKEEKDNIGNIKLSVERFLKDVTPLLGKSDSHSFEVRLYRCLPAVNICRIDNEMFWGPYLIGQPSRSNPTFIAVKGGILFDRLADHFQQIWTDPELSISVQEYAQELNREASS